MFFIVNKTKQNIVISDLAGLRLGPRQAIDLDKVDSLDRHKIEKSRNLKEAQKKGIIEIRIKDKGRKKNTIIETTQISSSDDLEKFKKEIIGEFKDTIKGLSSQIASQKNEEKVEEKKDMDLDELARKIASLMPKQEKIIVNGRVENNSQEQEVEIDNEVLSNIHKKTVEKMMEKTESSNVHYEEERKSENLDDNINELENLLGL
jgi:hypothetical protein